MYEIIGIFCGLAMATTALADNIVVDTVSDNDFVQIETFEDYGGDIVPYISDPYIEDNIPSDVVEEITVNQTVVDNSEVLERMDKLDSKLTLLNNSFNSVLSTGNYTYIQPTFYHASNLSGSLSAHFASSTSTTQHYLYVYDVTGIDTINYTFLGDTSNYNFLVKEFALDTNLSPFLQVSLSSSGELDVSDYNFLVIYNRYGAVSLQVYTTEEVGGGDTPDTPPSDPSGNDPSQPSINVTYPQEVIDNVNAMQKQLVTLTGVTLLNLIIPMFVSVFKRMVDPFKKRRED